MVEWYDQLGLGVYGVLLVMMAAVKGIGLAIVLYIFWPRKQKDE